MSGDDRNLNSPEPEMRASIFCRGESMRPAFSAGGPDCFRPLSCRRPAAGGRDHLHAAGRDGARCPPCRLDGAWRCPDEGRCKPKPGYRHLQQGTSSAVPCPWSAEAGCPRCGRPRGAAARHTDPRFPEVGPPGLPCPESLLSGYRPNRPHPRASASRLAPEGHHVRARRHKGDATRPGKAHHRAMRPWRRRSGRSNGPSGSSWMRRPCRDREPRCRSPVPHPFFIHPGTNLAL